MLNYPKGRGSGRGRGGGRGRGAGGGAAGGDAYSNYVNANMIGQPGTWYGKSSRQNNEEVKRPTVQKRKLPNNTK